MLEGMDCFGFLEKKKEIAYLRGETPDKNCKINERSGGFSESEKENMKIAFPEIQFYWES